MGNKYILVISTVSSKEDAEKIGNFLLEGKLTACINIVDSVTSMYIWQGKREKASECLLLIKSRQALFNRIKEAIKKHHSYEVPEVISVEISEGNKEYLKWIDSCL